MNKTNNSKHPASSSKLPFVFFGSSDISIQSLNELKIAELIPTLIVTKPDTKKGRGLVVTKSPVKLWAEENSIEVVTPLTLKDPVFISKLKDMNLVLGVLVSYGKIIPNELIELFPKGIVNMHPSLLPKLRGPSPIEFTILNDIQDNVGVSVMLLDKEVDHGPILSQQKIEIKEWPAKKSDLYNILGEKGGALLAITLKKWVSGELVAVGQDHSQATFSKIIEKKDGEITLESSPYKNYLKFRAFEGWPGVYFILKHNGKDIRVKITDADFKDDTFIIKKVIPEGKKEMDHESFRKGYQS